MADFVAVIRRAVDGLTDNSPDMRVKVYEKARGAVRRQLEAMNPRPSDDLVQRQLDKLEAAIAAVEGEHAEALPAEEPSFDLMALDEALSALAKMDERRSRVIELRFFGGLTVEETAAVLEVSIETVMRDARLAKAWLARELLGP